MKRIILVGLASTLVGCAYIAPLTIASGNAPRPREPYWSGLAKTVNRACYKDRGVEQIFGPTGGSYQTEEVDVVCKDGWVINLVNSEAVKGNSYLYLQGGNYRR